MNSVQQNAKGSQKWKTRISQFVSVRSMTWFKAIVVCFGTGRLINWKKITVPSGADTRC